MGADPDATRVQVDATAHAPRLPITVVTQDPRFGGGGAAHVLSFVEAAHTLGLTPRVAYARRPPLTGDVPAPLRGIEVRAPWARIDRIGLALAARRLEGAAREAAALWVVATAASYGGAAVRARRPFASWIATDLASEWSGRKAGTDPARRLAAGLSRSALLRRERDVLRASSQVYGISPFSAARLADAAGLPRAEVGVLPIPVDTQRFAPDDDGWRRTLARPTLVFVGRADDPRKNLPLLLSAHAIVRRWTPGVRVVVVGSPPVSRLPDGVEARGLVRDVAEALREATILVLPSRQEGFGIVAAEAMAAGVPVLSTPCGGPEELIALSGGGRVLAGFDPEEMATAIADMLADPALLERMRRSGRAHVEREHAPSVLAERLRDAAARLESSR